VEFKIAAGNNGSEFCWAGDVGRRGGKVSRISGDSKGPDDEGSDISSGNCSSAWMAGKEKGEGDNNEGIGRGGGRDTVGTGECWTSVSPYPSLSSSASHCHFVISLVRFAGGGVAVGGEVAVGSSGSGEVGAGSTGGCSEEGLAAMVVLLGNLQLLLQTW
jgi:hypothetical protein